MFEPCSHYADTIILYPYIASLLSGYDLLIVQIRLPNLDTTFSYSVLTNINYEFISIGLFIGYPLAILIMVLSKYIVYCHSKFFWWVDSQYYDYGISNTNAKSMRHLAFINYFHYGMVC